MENETDFYIDFHHDPRKEAQHGKGYRRREESSHIAAIGYLETERVLLVRYKDGSLYAQPQFGASEFVALLAAPSKGSFLYCRDRKGVSAILITKGVMPNEPERPAIHGSNVAAPGGNETLPPGALNVIDEDADKCCQRGLMAFFRNDTRFSEPWTCGDCGTQFYPEMHGPTRYWRIESNVAIVRPRR